MKLYLYNSLTRRKEEFKAVNPPAVSMYTCGPTVYDNIHIGNMRTYIVSDIVRRVLDVNGYDVKHVMNITDVGHLTGDNLGDSSQGEDRLEKGAAREGKTAWDIAKAYEKSFKDDVRKLNIRIDEFPCATDCIKEQIELVKALEQKGFTYKISDGIYFDTSKVDGYGQMSDLDEIKEGARIKPNPEKKNPTDFALWKFSETPGLRHMEWESPWGLGFPGWHIECSAMSMKCLTDVFKDGFHPEKFQTLDIHVGGHDLKQTHHPNEIAQSEGVTGMKFVNYWIHAAFLQVDGGRMGKSLGNAYVMKDVEDMHFAPLALRYFVLGTHYRKQLNFTWDALQGAQNALNRLRGSIASLQGAADTVIARSVATKQSPTNPSLRGAVATKQSPTDGSDPSSLRGAAEGGDEAISKAKQSFLSSVNDDINMPEALAVVWDVVKSKDLSSHEKIGLIAEFDKVLGLDLLTAREFAVPDDIQALVDKRSQLREAGGWEKADAIRKELEARGYSVEDTDGGTVALPMG